MSAVLSAIQAHRAAYAALSDAIDADPRGGSGPLSIEAGKAERAALNAVFAAPVASLSDVSAKAAYLADEIDNADDYFCEDPGELRPFLQSLRLSPDPLASLISEFRAFEAPLDGMTDEEFSEACRNPHPTLDRLRDDPPAATTMSGVEAALQLVADEQAKGNDWLDGDFIERTVMPFFRTRPAGTSTPDLALAYLEGGLV